MGGSEPPIKFSKRGGLSGPQLLEGCCWERGGEFFQGAGGGGGGGGGGVICGGGGGGGGGVSQFSHKNKLKSGIFNDKKRL